jgi:SNF2-related domain
VADVFLVDGGCSTTNTGRSCDNHESKLMVTAQQVYALTDNVQLHHAYHDHDDSNRLGTDLSIPGLLPTLRSYQCKAVEWMLRREQPSPTYEYSNNSDEWELAWIVLSSEIISNNDIRQTTQHDNPRHRQPELLSTWKRKHRFEQDNDIQNVLLFCPFTGWMTNSVSQATEWTIGPPSNTISVSGGILAESMGLGKTVEVLACILANPSNQPMTPSENCDTVVASAPNIHPVAKRQLNFNDCADSPVTNSTSDNQGASQRMTSKNAAVAIVDDMNEFCDAEIDSDIDSDSQALVLPVQTLTDVFETTNAKATTTEPISVAATVTPMKIAPACCVEERWTENDILGAYLRKSHRFRHAKQTRRYCYLSVVRRTNAYELCRI